MSEKIIQIKVTLKEAEDLMESLDEIYIHPYNCPSLLEEKNTRRRKLRKRIWKKWWNTKKGVKEENER